MPATVLVRRILFLIPVLIGISTIVFFLQRAIPGSPADFILGFDAPEKDKLLWLRERGLIPQEGENPALFLIKEYFLFVKNSFLLNFGNTYASNEPVFKIILPRFINTIYLALSAFSFSLILAVLTGVFSAAYAGKWPDKMLAVVSLMAISAPTFIIGPVLMWIFSVKLNWFPLIGMDSWKHFVLPSITLGAALAAFSSRMVRSGLVDVMHEDYIRTAKAKGLPMSRIIFKHALRNAFLPALTVLGMQLGVLLGGAFITEKIFNWPGLGTLTIEAVSKREYNVLSGCVIILAFVYVFSNLLVDILYRVFDPRVRFQ